MRSQAADGNDWYRPAHAAPRHESTPRGSQAATGCMPHRHLGECAMLPHAVPLDAYRSLTAQGSLPREKVHFRRRFSTPRRRLRDCCNDLRCAERPPANAAPQRVSTMRLLRLKATHQAQPMCYTAPAVRYACHVAAGRADCARRPANAAPQRVSTLRLRRAAKTACHRLSSSARANAKRRPSTCAPRCHQPRTLRFYHGTRHATAPRCAAPATSSCSLCAAPHPLVRPRHRAKP